MNNKYDDIIDTVYPFPKKHPPMSMEDRAAQFAPFAALTGFGDAIDETGRLTGSFVQLDDNEKDLLDEKLKLALMCDEEGNKMPVVVTYFVPDERKAGGSYKRSEGVIKRIDDYQRRIIFDDGTLIDIDMIKNIEPAEATKE